MRAEAEGHADRWLAGVNAAGGAGAASLGDLLDDEKDLDSRPTVTPANVAAPSLHSTVERDAAIAMRADAQLQEADDDDRHLAREAARIRPSYSSPPPFFFYFDK